MRLGTSFLCLITVLFWTVVGVLPHHHHHHGEVPCLFSQSFEDKHPGTGCSSLCNACAHPYEGHHCSGHACDYNCNCPIHGDHSCDHTCDHNCSGTCDHTCNCDHSGNQNLSHSYPQDRNCNHTCNDNGNGNEGCDHNCNCPIHGDHSCDHTCDHNCSGTCDHTCNCDHSGNQNLRHSYPQDCNCDHNCNCPIHGNHTCGHHAHSHAGHGCASDTCHEGCTTPTFVFSPTLHAPEKNCGPLPSGEGSFLLLHHLIHTELRLQAQARTLHFIPLVLGKICLPHLLGQGLRAPPYPGLNLFAGLL